MKWHETGALLRRKGISSAANLLRVILTYGVTDPILAPDRLDAGNRVLVSRFGRRPYGQGYIVPRASHPAIARDARLGRIPIAENRVASGPE